MTDAPVLDRAPATADAFVTLVTNAAYLPGVVALVRSLARTGTPADIVAMHTGGVSAADLAPLTAHGARLAAIDLLPTSDTFNAAHARSEVHGRNPFSKGEKPAFHTPLDNFAKLRLWQLPYRRVVFIDADALVLKPIDRLFDYPEFSAAPNVYESLADFGRLNSGVFTARPSPETFRHNARPPRHPRRLLEAHRPDLPSELLPRLARPAGLRQHAAVRLAEPARPLGLEPDPRPALPVRKALGPRQPQARPPRAADRPLAVFHDGAPVPDLATLPAPA